MPLKYTELVNAVTECPVYSIQCPRQLPNESGTTHQSSQPVRNWKIDYIGPLPLSEGSKYALACMDTISGLTQALLCCWANQAATIMGLEKLSTMYQYPGGIDSDRGSHIKGHAVQDWAKEHDIEWRLRLPHNLKAAGLVERKNGISKLK